MTSASCFGSSVIYDAVIVGAGVSGLLAAHELLNRQPAHILIVDAGLPLEARRAQAGIAMGGYGGAGLYLGGRLYLGAAALPVESPVSAPDRMRPVISGDAFVRRALEVDGLLHDLGARAEWEQEPPEPLTQAIRKATDAGLDYITSYPSRRLSLEDKTQVLSQLRERLEARGARFQFQSRVVDAHREGKVFDIRLSSTEPDREGDTLLRSRTLLLAPGRYGAEWLTQMARALDVEMLAAPSTYGVRLEVLASEYNPLTDANPDPRLQMATSGDALFKTYATCPGGYVAPVTRYGSLVASGVPILKREDRGPSTTVAALAQPGVVGARGEWSGGEGFAQRLNARAPGKLIVQRLGDVRRQQATTTETLARNAVQPTDRLAEPGALHDVYPSVYWRTLEEFLRRLDRIAPGVTSDDTLLYGPAEERFWHFPTDTLLQTNVPGLFVAGDGPGQSQGVIQASVAGLLAGEGMARALAETLGTQRV